MSAMKRALEDATAASRTYTITGSEDVVACHPFRMILPGDAEPDGRLTFATYGEAKAALLEILAAEIANARELLTVLRWNMTDARRTGKAATDRVRS